MNRSRLSIVIYVGMGAGMVLMALFGTAHAQAFSGSVGHFHQFRQGANSETVPEIDPAVAISGLSMLAGGVGLILDKFRRRNC